MKWQAASEVPEHLRPSRWRCPKCGKPCVRVGTPEIVIRSPLVNGGEYVTFECSGGHKLEPTIAHFTGTR